MKIIVPMAGRGSRLRPHSLTVPKPMLPVAGSPIVAQLVNEIARVVAEPIEEVAYVLGDSAFFGKSKTSNKHSEIFKRTLSRMFEMTKSP